MAVRKAPAKKTLITLKKKPAQKLRDKVVSDEALVAAIDRGVEIQRAITTLKEEDSHVRETVVSGIQERGEKSHRGTLGNATVSQRTGSTIYHEDALKKRLGADLWNKVTVRKLDLKKLTAFIAIKEVDAVVVAAIL